MFVSLYEGFGIPAMEAILRGQAGVTGDKNTATAEIVGDLGIAVDGRVTPRPSVEELPSCLTQSCRYGKLCFQRSFGNGTWAAMMPAARISRLVTAT